MRYANSQAYANDQAYANEWIEYRYNEIGNITYNSRIGFYTYGDTKHIHAVTQAGNYSYQYDENGNMNVRNGVALVYDYDNRVTSIGSTTNVYDYTGQRVKKNSTIYIGKLYECNNGVCTKHIFAGSQRVASKKIGDTDTAVSTDTVYYHGDHLGSTTIVTNASRGKEQETYYYPFGETRYNSGDATNYKYTGQEEDPETGLYYYGARYYDPIIGRFISADTVVPNFTNPQSLNRYSYVENNPLRYIDPTGHFKFETFMKAFVTGLVGGAVFVLSGGSAAFAAGAIGKLMLAGMAAGAAAGATSAALSGGNLGQILTGAAIGGALGGVGALASFAVGPAAVLAAGAAYSTAKGGLNGLAYFAGGLAGGIAGAVAAYDLMSPSPGAAGQAVEGDPLNFNGKQLTATDASGKPIGSWDAASGKPGLTPAEHGGPIPEGGYTVDPSKIQRWSDLPWYQKALAVVGRGEWPGGPATWGDERVPIDGSILTRGGFFIHSGWGTTTAGCIKILNGISSFFSYFSAQQSSIPLTVNYGY